MQINLANSHLSHYVFNFLSHNLKRIKRLVVEYEDYYCPFLLKPSIKVLTMILFIGWFIASLVLIPKVEVGLDQKSTFPKESYLIDYFRTLETYASSGPPAYIVIQDGYNYDNLFARSALCGSSECSNRSLVSELRDLQTTDGGRYIQTFYPFWIDNYRLWVTDRQCCRMLFRHRPCWTSGNGFTKRVSQYAEFSATKTCKIEGRGLHKPALEIVDKKVRASYLMVTTHLPKTDDDYIYSLKLTRKFSDRMSKRLVDAGHIQRSDKNGINPVFVYSNYYIFYEQYLYLERITMIVIGCSIWGISIATFLLLGMDLNSSIIVLLILLMTMIDLFGTMYLTGVQLNAVSVVNLVIAVGISVEFYVHIIRDYAITGVKNKTKRITRVLSNIGSSIFAGVTVPEMVSVAMLSSASSEIFQIYFFRMYFALIAICTLKAFVFLPVLLSYFGKPIACDDDTDEYSIRKDNSESHQEST
ncbi:hypothetical protein ACOME3_003458 [Neoechinorhynchus agilis]